MQESSHDQGGYLLLLLRIYVTIMTIEDSEEEGVMQKRMPLGYIALESGRKPIYAFDDFFLNYAFSKKKNWEELRLRNCP